ncbi:29117_t:CDS:1, partial [Racocetra persica]
VSDINFSTSPHSSLIDLETANNINDKLVISEIDEITESPADIEQSFCLSV